MPKLPLDGIRIVDMTAVIGAPYGMLLLAEMGAEVVRVESLRHFTSTTRGTMAHPPKELVPTMGPIGGGYPDFDPGDRPWNRFALFNCHAHNKYSMTADIATAKGQAIFKELVNVSDLVVDNQTNFMRSFGLGYDDLRRVRPDLIVIAISGTGAEGPYQGARGYGGHFENLMGHAWLRGYPEDHPISITPTVVASDPASGAALAWSALAALEYRERTGQGQYIDFSQSEASLHFLTPALLDYAVNGHVQGRAGNRDPHMAPHGVYPAAGDDRWVAVAVANDEQWRSLCKVLGRSELASEERFATAEARLANQDEIDGIISEWTRQRDMYEVQEALQGGGVPAHALQNSTEAMQDPQLLHRGHFVEVPHEIHGSTVVEGSRFSLSRTPARIERPGPTFGRDNQYVLETILGYSEEKIVDLAAGGVLE